MGGHRRARRRIGTRVAASSTVLVVLGGMVLLARIGGGDTGDATVVSAAAEPTVLPKAPPAGEEPESEGLPPTPRVSKAAKKKAAAAKALPLPLIPGIGGGSPLSTPLLSHPTGKYVVAPGTDNPAGIGREVRYAVEVEAGLPFTPAQFAVDVARILNSPEGWGHGGATMRFVRVDRGPVDFRVSLSSPRLTDLQCAPLRTYGKNLNGYRNYVVNHEVGHALGHHHVHCTVAGSPAPVMVQQTKSLEGCKANPWPYTD
jgi:hypothetical protein